MNTVEFTEQIKIELDIVKIILQKSHVRVTIQNHKVQIEFVQSRSKTLVYTNR